MCGRFTLTLPGELLGEILLEQLGLAIIPEDYRPRFNVAPSQSVLAARIGSQGREGVMLRWGLIPYWAKDPKIGYQMINARSESVSEKPSFRGAFQKRRCLIPADGFYEWRSVGGKKMPVRFRLRGNRLFAFAGLWESWQPPRDEAPVETFTILTTSANELISPVHERMPVIIDLDDTDAVDLWLDRSVPGDGVRHLLRPFPAEAMEAYAVSPRVNSPKFDDEACVAPLEETD